MVVLSRERAGGGAERDHGQYEQAVMHGHPVLRESAVVKSNYAPEECRVRKAWCDYEGVVCGGWFDPLACRLRITGGEIMSP